MTTTEQILQSLEERIRSLPPELVSTPEVAQARLSICETCPSYQLYEAVPQCAACTCFIVLKTQERASNCPLRKWKSDITPIVTQGVPSEPPTSLPLPEGLELITRPTSNVVTLVLPIY